MDPGVEIFLKNQIPVCLLAFAFSVILTKTCIFWGKKFKIIDIPSDRKKHFSNIPRIGGAALVISFTLAILLFGKLTLFSVNTWLGLAIFVVLGVLDDIYDLGPWQLIGQLLGALCVIMGNVSIVFFKNPLTSEYIYPGFAGILLTLFWILLLTNAINWFDGIDGLATGISLIAGIILFGLSLKIGQYEVVQLMLIFIAVIAGFLIFNFPPAKIFLGTIGVNFLGFMFSILSIQGGAKVATTFLVLALPIIDVGITIFRRIRAGQKIYLPDNKHLFNQLQNAGLSQKKILALLYSITLIFGLSALFGNTWQKLLIILAAVLLMLGLHVWAESRKS